MNLFPILRMILRTFLAEVEKSLELAPMGRNPLKSGR
jgi:hypothetical protein